MNKKTIIVTGGNAGIGFQASSLLAREGHEVILACRSEEKGNAAVEDIKRSQSGAEAVFMKLDLSSLASVREFAESFLATGKRLDTLICNAGMSVAFSDPQRYTSEDGFELMMATNHLGHFLLTNLLLENLKTTAGERGEARVVVVTSSAHASEEWKQYGLPIPPPLDADDLNLEKEGAYTGAAHAYKNSKLANILFVFELAEILKGTGVTANCVHPGLIPTSSFFQSNTSFLYRMFLKCCVGFCLRPFGTSQSPKQGGEALVQLATSEKVKGVSGRYFDRLEEGEPSEEARDVEKRKKVWEASARLVGLN